jgi:hypothetical protein
VFIITSAGIGGKFASRNFLTFSRVSAILVKVESHDNSCDSVSTALCRRDPCSLSALLFAMSHCTMFALDVASH